MEVRRRRTMSCPYLTEVTMCFCRAFPVKKLVPVDRVITDSACEGESYGGCPVFREAAARLGHAPADLDGLVNPKFHHGGKS
jgi:hypothetical protein